MLRQYISNKHNRLNEYGLELLNELLFIVIAKEAAKPWPVKVKGLKRIKLRAKKSNFLNEL